VKPQSLANYTPPIGKHWSDHIQENRIRTVAPLWFAISILDRKYAKGLGTYPSGLCKWNKHVNNHPQQPPIQARGGVDATKGSATPCTVAATAARTTYAGSATTYHSYLKAEVLRQFEPLERQDPTHPAHLLPWSHV